MDVLLSVPSTQDHVHSICSIILTTSVFPQVVSQATFCRRCLVHSFQNQPAPVGQYSPSKNIFFRWRSKKNPEQMGRICEDNGKMNKHVSSLSFFWAFKLGWLRRCPQISANTRGSGSSQVERWSDMMRRVYVSTVVGPGFCVYGL